MRTPILIALLTTAITACGGGDDGASVDAPPEPAPPRVIAGGGIGDGPISGVANVYVIDDGTRMPISGATVRVGEVEGTTDATGLFIASGVTGPQTVVVKATGYRAEVWVGANGANLTFDMNPATQATPPAATLGGQITGFAGLTVAAGHLKRAVIMYSQSDNLGDAANSIATPGDANSCVVQGANPCTFTIEVRTGKVALIAAIFDRDLKGTPSNFNDDTEVLLGWASRSGITVTGGVDQNGQDLSMLSASQLTTETVDFGTPPAALTSVAGLIGIDLGVDGVLQLGALFRTPADPALLVPKLTALGATGYRLTTIAQTAAGDAGPQSITLHRGLTGTTLAAGTWLDAPSGASATRTTATWNAVPGATVQSIEYTQGTAAVLGISVFDASTTVTIPDPVALPAGAVTAKFQAIGAEGLDVTNFSLDADRDKLTRVSAQPIQIN